MLPEKSKIRFVLAVVFAPIILPVMILLLVFFSGYFNVDLDRIGHFFLFQLNRTWPLLVVIYAGHFILLLPFCLILKQVQKLRLMLYLPGAYLLGGLTNVIGYPLVDPSSYHVASISGLMMVTLIVGGTYGFFQGYLFWYMAGLHTYAKAMRDDRDI